MNCENCSKLIELEGKLHLLSWVISLSPECQEIIKSEIEFLKNGISDKEG